MKAVERVGDGQVHALNVSVASIWKLDDGLEGNSSFISRENCRVCVECAPETCLTDCSRCVSQVMPTVVRIVLNLTFSITGLFKFLADAFI